jgi:hypothetical protein
MADKEIQALKEQIVKLEGKGFDLDSWKIFTINILERIFGADSQKIVQIKELKYDFSSWSLRDTSGTAGSIKKKAKVILESSISEIESFGLPEKDLSKNKTPNEIFLNIFSDELKGSQFKKLQEILNLSDFKEKNKAILELTNELDNETKEKLLFSILLKL